MPEIIIINYGVLNIKAYGLPFEAFRVIDPPQPTTPGLHRVGARYR